MLFSLQNKLIKKRKLAFQAVLILFASTFMNESFTMNAPYAHAGAPDESMQVTESLIQIPAQIPTQTLTTQIPAQSLANQTPLPPTQVTQTMQNPINMTVTTTINTPQALMAPLPTQLPQPMPRITSSTYGQTPDTVTLEHNMYRDSVWNALVPRKQLYEDPARKMQKPRAGKSTGSQRKSTASSRKNTKNTTNKVTTAGKNTNNTNNGTINLDSGSVVVIQPGSSVTVVADSPETKSAQGTQQGNFNASGSNNTPNASVNNNTANTPFIPNAELNPDIPQVKVPTPQTPPPTSLSIEPNFGA